MRRVAIFLGGELGHLTPDEIGEIDTCIAVDSGYLHAKSLGMNVDVLVGDFDSLSSEDLLDATNNGVRISTFDVNKDFTDFELALVEMGDDVKEIIVLAGTGARLDHTFGNIAALSNERFKGIKRKLLMGPGQIIVADDETVEIEGEPGQLISLIPFGCAVESVESQGLLYPLDNVKLFPYEARGVSNELSATSASIRCTGGVLLIIQSQEIGLHVLGGISPKRS